MRYSSGTTIAYVYLNMSQSEPLTWESTFRWNSRDGLGRVLVWNGSYQTNKPKMKTHSALSFTTLKDGDVGGFGMGVHDGLTENAELFVTPDIAPAELLTTINTYVSALGATTNRGKEETLAKNNAREALEDMLRTLASYVDSIAKGDPAIIMKAGFVPTGMSAHPNDSDITLDKPVIVSIRNGISGQLLVRVKTAGRPHAFEGQVRNGTGGWQTAGVSTQAREIDLNGLTPGMTYDIRVRGVGPDNTYSDWSDPSSHIAM